MNEFSKHFDDALAAICDHADAAMVAEPERCREIRQQAERDIAELPMRAYTYLHIGAGKQACRRPSDTFESARRAKLMKA